MNITQENPKQPDIIAMLEQLDAYCATLFPPESNHLMDIDSLTRAGVVFLAARDQQGRLLGCGAFVDRGDYAEVKRMMVDPASRGQGVGGKLLAQITQRAGAAGFGSLKLETGITMAEAIGLYERYGFSYREPFGDYLPDPLSVFMEKAL